jgi:HTH-type transcriptional regulator / antitoxin HigA
MITHKEYVKANLVVESLIDKVDDSTPNDSEIMKKFLAASDIVEAYEEIHFLI